MVVDVNDLNQITILTQQGKYKTSHDVFFLLNSIIKISNHFKYCKVDDP